MLAYECLCILYFIAHLCVCVFSGCVILCVCVFLFMPLWVELNPWWSLIPSRGVSLCHDHRESESERGRRMLCDGKEVVKWTTAVAIETLLATQHCCYPACLSANFRPVVSMNISVGSHFSGTPCAYDKLYIWYSRGEEKKIYLTARRHWNSPLSSQIKASAWERFEAYPAEKPFVIWS